jgi:3-deoxy-D-manno-octulosonate 8-phosphate phosphatase (KDO 8-P phosphatase)
MQDNRMVKPILGRVRVVFFEVDGVFTDGKTWQDQDGQWRRSFSVRDTMGVRALRKAGFRVCVLTPALSSEIRAHFERVGVDVFKDHCLDAESASAQILKALGFTAEAAAFVRESGSGGVELHVGGSALYVAARAGGDGAVLEISNLILQQVASLSAGQDIARGALTS